VYDVFTKWFDSLFRLYAGDAVQFWALLVNSKTVDEPQVVEALQSTVRNMAKSFVPRFPSRCSQGRSKSMLLEIVSASAVA